MYMYRGLLGTSNQKITAVGVVVLNELFSSRSVDTHKKDFLCLSADIHNQGFKGGNLAPSLFSMHQRCLRGS